MRRAFRIALWGLLVIVPAGMVLIPLPYYAVGPGPPREVAPLIRFDGFERFDSGGRLVLTTVQWYRLTPLSAVRVWVDADWRSLAEDELFPPGLDREEEEALSRAQMSQSQIHAMKVVLERLTEYPDEHDPGALIETTYSSCPADGVLFPGEIITAIDGEPIASLEDASRAIDAVRPGEPIDIEVLSGDAEREVSLARERCAEGQRKAYLGVGMLEPFPVDVRIESPDVGGPSGGLVFALALYDLLTPGDLTAGATVAVTGTLLLDGTVGSIGGIRDKVIGAEDAGATLFLVPRDNVAELEGVDTGDLQLVPVGSFDDAVDALLDIGGTDEAQAVPRAA